MVGTIVWITIKGISNLSKMRMVVYYRALVLQIDLMMLRMVGTEESLDVEN